MKELVLTGIFAFILLVIFISSIKVVNTGSLFVLERFGKSDRSHVVL